jgi:hypothetical protein
MVGVVGSSPIAPTKIQDLALAESEDPQEERRRIAYGHGNTADSVRRMSIANDGDGSQ